MIPVNQTRLGNGGNCLAACLASLLEISVDSIPDFHNANTGFWLAVEKWLEDFGHEMDLQTCQDVPYTEDIVILSGDGPRGRKHSVLSQNGKIIHDPHPDNSGLLKPEYFVRLD